MIIKKNNTFHLQGKSVSYIMAVNNAGDLLHIHYGKKLRIHDYSDIKCGWNAWEADCPDGWSLDICSQEYPSYGYTDLRNPAYSVTNADGNSVSQLKYRDFEIIEGFLPELPGLPCLFIDGGNAQTLRIRLADPVTGLSVVLSYSVFDEYDVILRSAELFNTTDDKMTINSAYSANLDLKKGGYELIYFSGAWARERQMRRQAINQGTKTDISNARGGSGHCLNPFVIVAEKGTDEKHGRAYSCSLVYSGNHSSMIECDQYGNVRLMQGINPFGFSWELPSGGSFITPQCVMCYSDNGIGGISRMLHDVFRNNLCKSPWVHKERPILINNWEATYFDFNEEKLLSIAERAAEAGIELFVLDDGWFGKRDDDRSSLGDWFVNLDKLPSGIKGLAEKINALGLRFGIWIEPEMISPNSELYRSHPDWAITVPGRAPALSRSQLILDLSRSEVCDYVISAIKELLGSAEISYVKWDMNRPMTDMPTPGFNHKYMLGFYRVISEITSAFPEVLFEGCSGGGGRFDAGILAYMPQIWTSDNSDAVSRLEIQYSTSIAYPISVMSAHVTAVPNHQNGRITSLKTRSDTAMAGVFGYELDIRKLNEAEVEEIKEQITAAKALRTLMQDGDFYRLASPYVSNYCIWEMVSKDMDEAFVFCCKILSDANCHEEPVRLEGLDPDSDYIDCSTGKVYHGDELQYMGFLPEFELCDFSTFTLCLKRIK